MRGGDGDDVVDGLAVGRRLLPHVLGEDLVEAQEHLVQHRHGAGVLIEIIGVRGRGSPPAGWNRPGEHPLRKENLKSYGGGGLAEFVHAAHAVLRQEGEDLLRRGTLGDEHGDLRSWTPI